MRRFLGFSVLVALVVYFAFYALAGERGWLELSGLEANRAELEGELAELRAEREILETRVALVRSGAMHPDMLDLLARRELGFSHPRDVILPLSEQP